MFSSISVKQFLPEEIHLLPSFRIPMRPLQSPDEYIALFLAYDKGTEKFLKLVLQVSGVTCPRYVLDILNLVPVQDLCVLPQQLWDTISYSSSLELWFYPFCHRSILHTAAFSHSSILAFERLLRRGGSYLSIIGSRQVWCSH